MLASAISDSDDTAESDARGDSAERANPNELSIPTAPLHLLGSTGAHQADFRETELPRIAVGDPATVWTMSDDANPIHGTVQSLGPGVQPDDRAGPGLPVVGRTLDWVVVAQRFPVWVRLDDPPSKLTRIGATASVRVHHDGAD